MKQITQRKYTLKDSFEVRNEVLAADRERASRALFSPSRNKYQSVSFDGAIFALKKSSAVCPNCGMRVPMYAEKEGPLAAGDPDGAWVEEKLRRLLCGQLSFFDESDSGFVKLNVLLPVGAEVTCPRCGTRGIISVKPAEMTVIVTSEKDRLTVSCELKDVFEALSVGWLASCEADFCVGPAPYSESVIFDFESGRTAVRLTDGNGAVCEKQIACEAELTGHDRISEVFGNAVLRRRIRSAFSKACRSEPCFTPDETRLDLCILCTRFIGYGRDFYDCIPFIDRRGSSHINERRLPERIQIIAEQMHRAEDIPSLYVKLGLPAVKSVRRTVFEEPQLMFYANELKLLSRIFPDINFFRRIIKSCGVYRILSRLARSGRAEDYLIMLREVLGSRRLCGLLEKRDCEELFNNGMIFYAMDDEERAMVRANIESSPEPLAAVGSVPESFSLTVPMKHMRNESYDWEFEGFRFRTLRTSEDYNRAGKELDNCLGEDYGAQHFFEVSGDTLCTVFAQSESTVVGVIKSGKYSAAIEVDEHRIVTFAAIEHNIPVEEDPEFKKAYLKWLRKFRLYDPRL